ERLGLTWSLMEAYGLTVLPRAKVLAPEVADVGAITRFHAREYVDILRAVSAGDWVPHAARYGLGPGDNPIFPGLWEAAQLVAGGSLLAARLVADGEADRAFHFAGGLHHAMPDRASGFCYVNDAVLAILALRQRGLKVAYVDIDAHHGDGVQYAFYGDPNVLTISTHERGERLFPGTGFVNELGEGDAAGFSVNLVLEAYTDTHVYLPAFEAVVPPLLERFKPDVIVAQLGIDSHRSAHAPGPQHPGLREGVRAHPADGAEARRAGRRWLRHPQRGARMDGGVGGAQRSGAARRATRGVG